MTSRMMVASVTIDKSMTRHTRTSIPENKSFQKVKLSNRSLKKY